MLLRATLHQASTAPTPRSARRCLVNTDTTTGRRHCLDVTFTDPSAQVNMTGTNPSTSAGLYKAAVKR